MVNSSFLRGLGVARQMIQRTSCIVMSFLAVGVAAGAERPPGRPAEPSVRYASDFPGIGIGARINAAYASLPATGGEIVLSAGGSFSTPVVFDTPNKPVLLVGLPADIVTLTYDGSSGAAIAFNYGTQHRMGHGMRDVTLTGPGNSSSTVGVVFGGANGAEGIDFRDFKIQSFGVNLQMGSNTWLAQFDHGMIRDGGINVLLGSNLTQAGEQIVFHHVTFADAPPPHTNSVWVQGGGPEVVFSDCSFDQAQLRVGSTGAATGAQLVVQGTHFENPNWQWTGAVNYDYITMDNTPGNYVRLTDSYFLQDATAGGPSRFISVNGGMLFLCGVGMFTPAGSPLTNFAVLANGAQVDSYGFDDLSGNIKGSRFGQ